MATKINRTTGDRALDEDIRRLYKMATDAAAEIALLKAPATTPTNTPAAPPLPPNIPVSQGTTVNPVEASSVVGIMSAYAPSDHAHEGVHSVAAMGSPELTGDVIIHPGDGLTIDQTGNTITLNSVFNTIPPTRITHASSPYTVGAGDFVIFADTSAGAIAIVFPGIAPNAGRSVVIMNISGTNPVTVSASPGSIGNITTIASISGTNQESVWYICDGANWYSYTNSVGN